MPVSVDYTSHAVKFFSSSFTHFRVVADTFVLTFIYAHSFEIILRFTNQQVLQKYGYKHGKQRWNLCYFQFLNNFMRPAVLVMYEQRRSVWDRTLGDWSRDLMDERADIVGSGEKLIWEAVGECKRIFREIEQELPVSVAADVLDKINGLKLVVGLQKSIFPVAKLKELYAELDLKADEGFLKSLWEMQRNHRRIRNEPSSSWRRQLDQMVNTSPKFLRYNIEDGNILYVSPIYLVYPWYHPIRPRFFNMATLFREVLETLIADVEAYVKEHHRTEVDLGFAPQIAFEHYRNWLRNNTEMQIGANYLTNEQLYWVAYAVSTFVKYHKTVPKSTHTLKRLQNEYLHVLLKSKKGFQDAFRCNLTAEEDEDLQEYLDKYHKLKLRRRKMFEN